MIHSFYANQRVPQRSNAPHLAKERLVQLGPYFIAFQKNHLGEYFALLLIIMGRNTSHHYFGDAFRGINATTAALYGLSILLCTGVSTLGR